VNSKLKARDAQKCHYLNGRSGLELRMYKPRTIIFYAVAACRTVVYLQGRNQKGAGGLCPQSWTEWIFYEKKLALLGRRACFIQ